MRWLSCKLLCTSIITELHMNICLRLYQTYQLLHWSQYGSICETKVQLCRSREKGLCCIFYWWELWDIFVILKQPLEEQQNLSLSQYQSSFLFSFLFLPCFPHLQGSWKNLNLVHHKKIILRIWTERLFPAPVPIAEWIRLEGGVIWSNLPIQAWPSQITWYGI